MRIPEYILSTSRHSIDWGDGSPVEVGEVTEGGGSGTVSATHVYNSQGAYSVTVCVSDDDGETGCDSFSVTVSGSGGGPITILETHFNSNEHGFSYVDDPFRGTSEPSYAEGVRIDTGGFTGGVLQVTLGGIDNADILGMSWGWQQNFTLSSSTEVSLSFCYNLTQALEYESDELSQALVSIDGTLYGEAPNDYVAQIVGNGNGGSPETTGWQLFQVDLGTLEAGDYTLTIGGYNNKKTSKNETTELLIDDVLVVGVDNTAPTIQSYPNIDHDNNTIDITFSETDMQNVTDEANYRFSPSLNFATPLVDGDDITNPSGSTYRLTMASIPAYTILTLTVSNITDAAGNPVTPSSITINDNDSDDMADDWETDNSVDDLDEDPDGDGLNNLEEYDNNTNPNNSDTDGDSLPDDWEVAYGLDPNDSAGVNGSDGDFDDDGWTNYEEWVNGTDPLDDTPFPTLSPPEIIEAIPHHNAGINDDTRVPNITSFYVRIEDSDGIDITDTESIMFTISDGVNGAYTRDLGDTTVVRVVKLTEDEDTQVTRLWVVYDRCREDEFGNYDYDTQINIKVYAKDRRGGPIDSAPTYDFKIESETQHDYAQDPDNLPDTGEVASDDPDLEDPEYYYNAGIQVNSGDLEGAKIVYDSDEPLTPRFGPRDEIPSFDLEGERGEGVPVNLQPPTVFNTPVKIFIPYPVYTDVRLRAGSWLATPVALCSRVGMAGWCRVHG